MTQISNLKVIGLMVDFLKIIKLWRLSTEFYGVGQLLPHTTELSTLTPRFDNFFKKINHKADNFHT